MNKTICISLTIPFYNEEECAEKVITELLTELSKIEARFEIILVENASTDSTRQILNKLSNKDKRLRLIKIEKNIGYGGAVLKGMAASTGDLIGFTCGDGEITPQDVYLLCNMALKGGVDIYKAKRLCRKDGIWRQFLSFFYHVLVGLFFKIHITDVNGYPLIMTKKLYNSLGLSYTNWVFNVEMLMKARKLNARIAEIDVIHEHRTGGQSHINIFTPLIFLLQLFRLWINMKKK